MIWHIFRKDFKLLWWKVLIVEALLVFVVLGGTGQGHFTTVGPSMIEIAGAWLIFAAGLFLVADLAQIDPPDGMGQDWVARPVSRVEMMLAKLVFLLVVGTPMVLVDAGQSLAYGFPVARALSGAILDSLTAVVVTGVPILAFASLFSSLTETVAAVFIAILAKFTIGFLIQGEPKFPLMGSVSGSAIHWVVDIGQSWVYVAGALAILAIQYFRRKTIRARWVAVVVLVITSVSPLLPWQYAFAVEQRLSPAPGAGANANIFFDPSLGHASDSEGRVCIPIAVFGVADERWLNIDGVKASVLHDGKVAWSHRISGEIDPKPGVWKKLRGDFLGTAGSGVCQSIEIPPDELKTLEDQPVRAQLDYSLTLFEPDKSYAMPAVGGDQRMPGVGWCQTRMKNRLEIGCISDNGPACLEAWTTNAPGSTAWFCNPDYDAVREVSTDPWGGELTLKVHKGDTLVLRSYQPLDHFERVVTTPEIKLRDWITAGQ